MSRQVTYLDMSRHMLLFPHVFYFQYILKYIFSKPNDEFQSNMSQSVANEQSSEDQDTLSTHCITKFLWVRLILYVSYLLTCEYSLCNFFPVDVCGSLKF